MPDFVRNQLCPIRSARGLGAAELAKRVGVSRQTIYAIESGAFVPNTVVSLRLARELNASVEELFSLPPEDARCDPKIRAEVLSSQAAVAGQPARLCRIGSKWVAVPVESGPCFLSDSDALATRAHRNRLAEFAPFTAVEGSRLALAGCDPAIGLLAAHLWRESGVELVTAATSSRVALRWLKEGRVHIAGTHLRDSESGEFNLPLLRREFAGQDLAVVTFARWEEGFVTAPGNPRGINRVEHLASRRVSFLNREEGSGSRALFDRLARDAGWDVKRIAGFNRIATGHLAAAYAVSTGQVDCCIGTRSAARAFGLGFVPLQEERFDFVLLRRDLMLSPVQALLEALQRASLRGKLERQAGYDTRDTGATIA